MDIGSVARQITDEALATALADLATVVEGDAASESDPTPTLRAPSAPVAAMAPLAAAGEAHGSAAAAPPAAAGARADHNVETQALQAFARPPAHAAEAPRPTAADPTLPSVRHAASGFTIPADQLVPVALANLQVDPATAWALAPRAFDAPLPEPVRPPAPPVPDDDVAEPPELTAEEQAPPRTDDGGAGVVAAAEDDTDWCEPLTRALREALSAKVPPQSLLAAAEQWQRGRCVVLACPQGGDPAGPAWGFVLWPRARQSRRLELFGLRVPARLQWSSLPPPAAWCHVRVIKEHHPRRGRQLIPLGAAGDGGVPCEVQLGPVLARSLRWCVVCLRIDAVRRFWNALGTQWSATVVVCARPLAGPGANPMESSC